MRIAISASPRARSRRSRVLMMTISMPPAAAESRAACWVRNRLIEVVAVMRTGASSRARAAFARVSKRATASAAAAASAASATPICVGISRLAPRWNSGRPSRASKALRRRATVVSLSPSADAARARPPVEAMAWKILRSAHSEAWAAAGASRRDGEAGGSPMRSGAREGPVGCGAGRGHGRHRAGLSACAHSERMAVATQPGRLAGEPGAQACQSLSHRSISSPAKAARSWMKRKRASGLLPISRSTVSEVSSFAS